VVIACCPADIREAGAAEEKILQVGGRDARIEMSVQKKMSAVFRTTAGSGCDKGIQLNPMEMLI